MKKRTVLIAIAMVSIAWSQAQQVLEIDITKSELKWFGEYTFFFNGHDGAISFKEGYFVKMHEKITGGEFIIDMNTITNADITNSKANKGLVEHLENADFFDVQKYPTAKLVITNTLYHDATHLEIRADLTIKDRTLPIKFQAEVDYETMQMNAKFKIDRMLWGIEYNSDMRDSAISDAIGFHVKLSL